MRHTLRGGLRVNGGASLDSDDVWVDLDDGDDVEHNVVVDGRKSGDVVDDDVNDDANDDANDDDDDDGENPLHVDV